MIFKPIFGKMVQQAVTWNEAQTYCNQQGGVLAYYDNDIEKAMYVKALNFNDAQGRVWLGKQTLYIF